MAQEITFRIVLTFLEVTTEESGEEDSVTRDQQNFRSDFNSEEEARNEYNKLLARLLAKGDM